MAYPQDISSLHFLAANVIYQATNGLLAADNEEDRGILDDAVLMMDVVSSYDTETDPKFAVEWQAIQDRRKRIAESIPKGQEAAPEVLETLRWAELKAQFRSLCRAGRFVRQSSPGSDWKPTLEVKA